MQKYKNKYFVKYEKDSKSEIYNRDDNYLACRSGGQVYRYNKDTLKFVSSHKIKIKKEKDGIVEFDYTDLLLDVYDTDEERIITFKEENLEKLEGLFKIRKRKKMNLTEEQKEVLRERLRKAREDKGLNSAEISEADLEEELNSEDEDVENDNEIDEEE